MTKQVYTEFAALCESIIAESSTAMDMVRSVPGGQEVVKKLHTVGLEHDQTYQDIGKISWSELKDSSYGKWVIIKGDKGVGAIKATSGAYKAFASTGQGVEEFSNDRGGNILDFLKGKIGGLRSFYAGAATNTVRKKQGDRKERNAVAQGKGMDKYALMEKFKPMWLRAMTAAHADIKGIVVTMIKNDAFEKAKKKLSQLEQLESGIDQVEQGSGTPDFIENSVNLGILMAAHHYYPDDTGEIRKNYGRNYSSNNEAGPKKLLNDIATGDTKKLGTVLAFFKRSLISG